MSRFFWLSYPEVSIGNMNQCRYCFKKKLASIQVQKLSLFVGCLIKLFQQAAGISAVTEAVTICWLSYQAVLTSSRHQYTVGTEAVTICCCLIHKFQHTCGISARTEAVTFC
jgi:hypothetical protein